MKHIRKFNESTEPHEITDYFLELIEDEGFTYEPTGSNIRLFYSGPPKDESLIFTKYKTLIKRLERNYEIISKSFRIEQVDTASAIEIVIKLSSLEEFKIEFYVDGRKWSGNIISCDLQTTSPTNLVGIKINLDGVNPQGRTTPTVGTFGQLRFWLGAHPPWTDATTREFVFNNGEYYFLIDPKNVQKILTAIKSGNIKFHNTIRLEEARALLAEIKPQDLAS